MSSARKARTRPRREAVADNVQRAYRCTRDRALEIADATLAPFAELARKRRGGRR